GDAGPVGTAQRCATVADDGEHQPHPGWPGAAGSGRLSVDAAQVYLPDALPLTFGVSDDRLACGTPRRPHHGSAAWHVLCGLLLVPHGLALCRGGDELAMGSGHRSLCAGGESRPPG